ncbi:hypothetical protein FOL47_000103 [Perkinsus chesapeaki]|uniref:Uncharacterized protein n=1 Tax=Perkinsus chesapeaki TaxID=330153 RepID=A0A7J6N1A0_PERCH|nr:hypothetical protein FOL47_000103 [Perkinsus chesapeaki]
MFLSFLGLVFSLRGRERQIPVGKYTRTRTVGQDEVDIFYEFSREGSDQLMVRIGVTCNGVGIPHRKLPVKGLSEMKHEVDFGDQLNPFMDDVKQRCTSLQLASDDFKYVIYTVGKVVQIQRQGDPLMLYLYRG